MRRADGRNARSRLLPAMIAVAALLAVGHAAGDPGESTETESGERIEAGATAPVAGPTLQTSTREPDQRLLAEQEAIAAAAAGLVFEDPAQSPTLESVLEELRRQPAPPGEVFALIKATDRTTGERRVFTRGVPDPMLGNYLDDATLAPAGKVYAEADTAWADGDVEVTIRSIQVVDAERPASSIPPAAEEEADLRSRNAGTGMSFRIEPSLREQLAELSAQASEDAAAPPIPVVIELKDVPRLSLPKAADPANGGLLWAGLDVLAERERRIIERKQSMLARQRPVMRAVEAAGGIVDYASWTSGSIQALLPPAAVEALADHPAVFSLEYLPPATSHGHRYLGDDIYVATNAQDYDPWHAGFHGLSSKHSYTSRIVVAMSEECVNTNIPPWRTLGPGSASRGRFYDIDPTVTTLGGLENCWNSAAHAGTGHAQHRHGHWVLSNMAGDLMDGQEPVLTTSQRRQRTGTCEECFFLFGQDWSLNQRSKAHDWACGRGADIFQSSIGYGSSCDGNGSFDGNLQSLVNCDVVYVQSAGNNGSTGGCSTGYPADHPWTFAVGGVDTEDPCDTAGEYYTTTCPYETNASRGGATYDGCSGCADVVDLAAPYRVCHVYNPDTANPTSRQCVTGTSFSSPIVAGLMARVMDWYRQHLSTSIFYDNRARNFMLLMGDRSAGSTGAGQWLNTTDPRWGAGRVRLEPFDGGGTWSVFRGSVTLGRNSSWTWSYGLPDNVRLFKAVVWHTGKDYSNEPKIRLTLNPTGCSTATSSVDRLDAKTLLKMQLNGCTGMTITVRNIGVGFSGTRKFHVAAYGVSRTSDRGF